MACTGHFSGIPLTLRKSILVFSALQASLSPVRDREHLRFVSDYFQLILHGSGKASAMLISPSDCKDWIKAGQYTIC